VVLMIYSSLMLFNEDYLSRLVAENIVIGCT
jgi:hypothetical protein